MSNFALSPAARAALLVVLSNASAAGCFGRGRTGPDADGAGDDATIATAPRAPLGAFDVTRVYQQAGMIAEAQPIAFVGQTYFLAGASPDSTLVLLALSLPARTLTFAREGDRYRGEYEVIAELRQAERTAARIVAREVVRVGSYRETQRGEESIVFQQFLRAAPGQYVLALIVRDPGSNRNGTLEQLVTVPRIDTAGIATPVAAYETTGRSRRDSLPALIPNPRATAIFGRDSLLRVYLEAYGTPDRLPLAAAVVAGKGGTLWSDSVVLARRGDVLAATLDLPVSRLGVGLATLVVRRPGASDSVRVPVFVGFGENLAVASFEQMLDYLRLFATPERLRLLRDTPPEQRGAVWTAFLRETDPAPTTSENEALRDYFNRIEAANTRFRDEGSTGWLSDQGMVFVGLGEPDQIFEQGTTEVMATRGRTRVWQYQQYRVNLVFVDQTGFGRWRLTTTSEQDFRTVLRRVQLREAR